MRKLLSLLGVIVLATIAVGSSQARAQDSPGLDFPEIDNPAAENVFQVSNCMLFGAGRGQFKFQVQPGNPLLGLGPSVNHPRSALTQQVMRVVASSYIPGASRAKASQDVQSLGTIDKYIFGALQDAGVTPADPTTDAEFIRRITLDLTGRIPTADRLVAFLNDTTPNKRANLIE
jgi:hypothetical protein